MAMTPDIMAILMAMGIIITIIDFTIGTGMITTTGGEIAHRVILILFLTCTMVIGVQNDELSNESALINKEKGIAMKTKKIFIVTLMWLLMLLAATPLRISAQYQPAEEQFREEELDQMLAPIALYPDSLLAQILMAATYPIEIVQADRWAKANRYLRGDHLNDALDQKTWDPSVKALVPFPQVLSMMSERLEWTQRLGDAFLDQPDEIMDTVQRLRARAQAAGYLRDTEQQRVFVQEGAIEIEPAQPEVIYVPVYDPRVIYGPWWHPAFPPFFFPPPPRVVFVRGFGFWSGVTVGRTWDYAWGRWDWRNHYVHVNINRNININRTINIPRRDIRTTRWQHDVSHRKGVTYRNQTTRERYGQSIRGAETRRDYRGFRQETRYQQAPVAAPRGPAETRGQQASGANRQGPPETRYQQPPVATPKGLDTRSQQASGVNRQGPPETRYQQPPVATPKSLDTRSQQASGANRQGTDLSKTKNAFEGIERGTDARIQSNRGLQSRQGMSTRETDSVSHGNVGRPR